MIYKLSVLFLCIKNDQYSNLCINYLTKKFYKVKIIVVPFYEIGKETVSGAKSTEVLKEI